MGNYAVEYRSEDGSTVQLTGFPTFDEAAAWVRDHASGWWAHVRYVDFGDAGVPAAA